MNNIPVSNKTTILTSTFHAVYAKAVRLAHKVAAFPNRPGYRSPDPSFVNEFTIRFKAPHLNQRELLQMLITSEDFVKALPTNRDYNVMVELGCTGYELRANVYEVIRIEENSGTEDGLRRIYETDWTKTGMFRYIINPDGVTELVTRDNTRRVGMYDSLDVIYSYARRLTQDEVAIIHAIRSNTQ